MKVVSVMKDISDITGALSWWHAQRISEREEDVGGVEREERGEGWEDWWQESQGRQEGPETGCKYSLVVKIEKMGIT